MWITLTLIAAVGTAFLAILGKRLVATLDPLVSVVIGFGFSVLFLLAGVLWSGGIPHVTIAFFGLALASGALDGVAHSCTLFALRRTPVSVAAPMTAFTPVFAVAAAALLLGQTASPPKLVGILLIAGGAYLLNLSTARQNWLRPFARLLTDPGVRLILLASLIWGLTPIIQTRLLGETHPTSPLFASLVSFTFMVMVLAGPALRRLPRRGLSTSQWGLAALFGLVASTVTFCGWKAYTLINPSFVVALSKTSIIFGVVFGALFFGEKSFRERLTGATVMLAGVMLLAL